MSHIQKNAAGDTFRTDGILRLQWGLTSGGIAVPLLLASDGSSTASLSPPAGGFSTATNQATQITAEQAIQAALTIAPSQFLNVGANATLNVKSSSGKVFSLYCHNSNAATRYLQLHNTATVPAGGDVPVKTFVVFSTGQTVIGTDFFTNAGLAFSTGIAFAFSTTRDTYTAGSAGDQQTQINFT